MNDIIFALPSISLSSPNAKLHANDTKNLIPSNMFTDTNARYNALYSSYSSTFNPKSLLRPNSMKWSYFYVTITALLMIASSSKIVSNTSAGLEYTFFMICV